MQDYVSSEQGSKKKTQPTFYSSSGCGVNTRTSRRPTAHGDLSVLYTGDQIKPKEGRPQTRGFRNRKEKKLQWGGC